MTKRKNFDRGGKRSVSPLFIVLGIVLLIYSLIMIFMLLWGLNTSLKSDMDYSAIISKNVKSGAEMKNSVTYKKGERVAHKKFGEGMIVGITESGDDMMLEILFDNVGTRNLMASFAKLKKL